MNKQFPPKNLAQSYVNSNVYIPMANNYNHQPYYPVRPNTHYTQYSPQKMSHSLIGPSRSQNSFDLRLGQIPPSKHLQQPTNNSFSRLDSKQNVRTYNIMGSEAAQAPYRIIQNRLREIESRIERIEKQQKKGDLINKNVEQLMRLQIKDIKCNEQLEERLVILEDMMTHVKNTKIDRAQLESSSFLDNKYLEDQINQLRHQGQTNKEQIKDTRESLHRLVPKIESTIVAVGEKYEQFIQRNIIKSIDQVNKLTRHYHQEIQTFKLEQAGIKQKIEQFIQKQTNSKEVPLETQLIALSLPNLKVIQSIAVIDERRLAPIRQQSNFSKESPKMTVFAGGLFSSFCERSTQSSSSQLLLQKVTYKLDRQFYLLDEHQRYILDGSSSRIRLQPQHIALLQDHNLIQ